jgi:hypothetical protein
MVFFWPYRRGQGLSASTGTYIGEEIDVAKKNGGIVAGYCGDFITQRRVPGVSPNPLNHMGGAAVRTGLLLENAVAATE